MTDRFDPEIEVLPPGSDAGDDARAVRDPGWVGRNRETLGTVRRFAGMAILIAPPPARIPLAAGCVALDAVLVAGEAHCGGTTRDRLGLRAAGLVLEGAALLAATRHAPALLLRNRRHLNALRRAANHF